MGYKAALNNALLDHAATLITHASAHTGFPATISAGNEVTGGSPAYARKAITFASASSSSMAANGTLPTFDIPAGTTVAAIGFCSAISAGTIYADADVTDEVFGGQGTYTLTAVTFGLT